MQVYVNSIEPIEFSFLGYKVQIGVFTVGILLCLKWLIKLIISCIGSFFIKLFLNGKSIGEQKSINNISKLILLNNEEFINTFRNVSIIEKYKNITTALIIKNNIKTNYLLNKTGVQEIDIYLLNNELEELLESNKYSEAFHLINNNIKKYSNEINIIKDKLLKVAKYCQENNIKFKFNPKKSRYKLDKKFINDYEIELEMIDFKKTNDNDNKLKIVEYLYKKFPENKNTGLYLLQFLEEYKPVKYNDSKIINLMQSIFISNPNRDLAYIFLKLYNQSNIFEISQEILKTIPNSNLEKVWFLLVIATNMKLFNVIKELINNIIEINNNCNKNKDIINELNEFFIKNYNILSTNSETVRLFININNNQNLI